MVYQLWKSGKSLRSVSEGELDVLVMAVVLLFDVFGDYVVELVGKSSAYTDTADVTLTSGFSW